MITEQYTYHANHFRSLAHGAFRRLTGGKCQSYPVMESFCAHKYGLEIGGPSRIFRRGGLIPIYDRCGRIDSCNFSDRTLWSDVTRGEWCPRFEREFVAEASDLSSICDTRYDFVLASHVLEHVANPLRALYEWKRVLVAGGAMLVIVPDRRHTFDHRRPTTSIEHIESDFQANTTEDDLTHLEEILALHDLNLDRAAGSRLEFGERCLQNGRIRAMHHHVFDPELLRLMFARLGMQTLVARFEAPCHVVAFAEKTHAGVDSSAPQIASNQ